VNSRDEFIQLQKSFLISFPDQQVTVQQLVAEGDYVAALATYSGTHMGPMGEFPATGRPVESPFLALFRIEADQIVELWSGIISRCSLSSGCFRRHPANEPGARRPSNKPLEGSALSIYVAPVPDLDHHHGENLVLDRIDDPIVSLTNSIAIIT